MKGLVLEAHPLLTRPIISILGVESAGMMLRRSPTFAKTGSVFTRMVHHDRSWEYIFKPHGQVETTSI